MYFRPSLIIAAKAQIIPKTGQKKLPPTKSKNFLKKLLKND